MNSTKPEVRKLQRDGWCRVCAGQLVKDETDCVSWYSTANRGQNIHICVPCVVNLYKLTNFHAMLNKDSK